MHPPTGHLHSEMGQTAGLPTEVTKRTLRSQRSGPFPFEFASFVRTNEPKTQIRLRPDLCELCVLSVTSVGNPRSFPPLSPQPILRDAQDSVRVQAPGHGHSGDPRDPDRGSV